MFWLIGGLLLGSQETASENELLTAAKTTVSRGFTYVVKPVATIPDGFPKDREALAGVEVRGRYRDGLYQATNGEHKIFRKGSSVAVMTARGWLPLDAYTSALRQDVAQAFDPKDERFWSGGNVTAGRTALAQLIRISHLVHRSDVGKLIALGRAFRDLQPSKAPAIDGRPATLYEGDLTDLAAFEILQGPFEALVQRGTLSFRNVSGVGRVYVQDGLLRRVHVKAAGAYAYYEDSENVRRKGLCALEIVAEITKVGETELFSSTEAERALRE
jgi:hypothetical protein